MLNKTATRLPEGLFLRFNVSAVQQWHVEKIGHPVDPFDVVNGGGLRHHGVDAGVFATLAPPSAALFVDAPDAPLVAVGVPTIFPVPNGDGALPDPHEGISFLLYDNLWSTNYPFWYPFAVGDEMLTWRFSLVVFTPPSESR